jgi:hypothetical protein
VRPRSGEGLIALPRHVKRRDKRNGRVYIYYEKFRGTARAWPRVSLPSDPFSTEFVRRVQQCERLAAARDDSGQWTWRITDAVGRLCPLPDPKQAHAFWDAVDKAEKIGTQLAAGDRKTFAALVREYRDSDAFNTLAKETRSGYSRYLGIIEESWGNDPVASLTPVDVQKAIDSYQATPASARYFRSVLSRLISWGIPRGYRNDNPVEHTEKVGKEGTYSPWPDWAFEIFLDHARVGLHLPVYSALYTGQRSADIFKMLRPKSLASEMPIVQQKTGIAVPVQIHSDYRAIIDAAKADHVMLHLREDGHPWTQDGFQTAWQRELSYRPPAQVAPEQRDKAAAMKRLRDHRIVFHGLRKNAVINLLEVGCTEDEVGAIVGMSPAMVRHYAREVRKHHLAINAMKKLEAGWKGIRSGPSNS